MPHRSPADNDRDFLLGLAAALGLTTAFLPWAQLEAGGAAGTLVAATDGVRLFGLTAPTWFLGLLAAGAPALVLALRRHGQDVSPSLARIVTHALAVPPLVATLVLLIDEAQLDLGGFLAAATSSFGLFAGRREFAPAREAGLGSWPANALARVRVPRLDDRYTLATLVGLAALALSLGALWFGTDGLSAGFSSETDATLVSANLAAILSGATTVGVLLHLAGRLKLAAPVTVGLPAGLLAWGLSILRASEVAGAEVYGPVLCVTLASALLIGVMVFLPPGRRSTPAPSTSLDTH